MTNREVSAIDVFFVYYAADSLPAGHLSKNTGLPPRYRGVLHHDAGTDLPLSPGGSPRTDILFRQWPCVPAVASCTSVGVPQIVGRGNDQVALSSKFETREDFGQWGIFWDLDYYYFFFSFTPPGMTIKPSEDQM